MDIGYKEKIAATTTYLLGIAACFLFGYWGAFNINILELGSFADLAKLAIFPLLASLAFFVAGIIGAEMLFKSPFPVVINTDQTNRRGSIFTSIKIAAIVAVAIFFPEPGKWFVVAFLVSSLSSALHQVGALAKIVPDPPTRALTLYFLLLLPGISFAYGRVEAFLIKSDNPTRTVDIGRSKVALTATPKKPVAYLGYVGGNHVLYESVTGQVVFLKQKDENPLFIQPHYR
jgi:hypothetical protein